MRKIIAQFILLFIPLILIGCSTTKDETINIHTKDITKIVVTTGGDKTLKTTENKDEITNIVNYINGLDLIETSENATEYDGLAFVITIYFSNNTSNEYIHYGNKFFRESEKGWYKIPYQQAEKFESIYNSLGGK
jgi:hypothetical protein